MHTRWMGIDVVHHLYSFNIFCSEDLQLLQQPIDAWKLLKRLLYQSTVGKKANAPGLSQTCQPVSIVSLSGVDRYDSDCFSPFFHFLYEFCINLVFFQITLQSVYVSRARPYRVLPSHIHCCYFLSYIILIITWPYQVMRLCMTYVVIGLTIVALQSISFVIRSFLILCWIHLKILISVMFIFWRSALCNA